MCTSDSQGVSWYNCDLTTGAADVPITCTTWSDCATNFCNTSGTSSLGLGSYCMPCWDENTPGVNYCTNAAGLTDVAPDTLNYTNVYCTWGGAMDGVCTFEWNETCSAAQREAAGCATAQNCSIEADEATCTDRLCMTPEDCDTYYCETGVCTDCTTDDQCPSFAACAADGTCTESIPCSSPDDCETNLCVTDAAGAAYCSPCHT
jgi:hypothetical protein